MRKGSSLLFLAGAILLAIAVGVQLFDRPVFGFSYGSILPRLAGETARTEANAPVAFTGDVMLAREVEQYMRRYGTDYPFAIFSDLPPYEYLFINFEATVPKQHQPTPAEHLQFSVPKNHLVALREAGVTHASLANNHSFDFGGAGYLSSQQALKEANVEPFGHPTTVTADSATIVTYSGAAVAVIGLNPLEHVISDTEIDELFTDLAKKSDLQLAYVHWGIEYEAAPSHAQRKLAHRLIDAGVDAVIGHHPHVVQGIEAYQGKLIFYSLGNLIFDQYFSDEVMRGLILELSAADGGFQFELVPVSSRESRIQPRLLSGFEREAYLRALAAMSDQKLRASITRGEIRVDETLAY